MATNDDNDNDGTTNKKVNNDIMGATGNDNDNGDGNGATKLTMMATTTTMATGEEDDNGDGVTGNGATGYNNDGNG